LSRAALKENRNRFCLQTRHPLKAKRRIGFHEISRDHGRQRHAGKKNRRRLSRLPAMQTGLGTALPCGPDGREASHSGGGRLRPGDLVQCLIQAVTIAFAVISAAKFAVAPEVKCPDFSTAI